MFNFKISKIMEIDWGTTIVGLVIIALVILPFVLMHYNKKNKMNKLLRKLNDFAKQQGSTISQHEFCSDFVMGLDEHTNYVFFVKEKKDESISKFVNLADIQRCKIDKIMRTTRIDKNNYSVIERLELSFVPTVKTMDEQKFEIYDETLNKQLSGEIQFAENWAKQINSRLKRKK